MMLLLRATSSSSSSALIAIALMACGLLLVVQQQQQAARHSTHLVRSDNVNDNEWPLSSLLAKIMYENETALVVSSLQQEQQQDRHLQAAAPKQLVMRVRVADKPTNTYKLGRCEGDCNTDSDCQTGLQCKHRKIGEDVPGCFDAATRGGRGVNPRADFCYDPNLVTSGSGGGTSSGGGGGSGGDPTPGAPPPPNPAPAPAAPVPPGFNPNNIHNPNPPRDRWVVNSKEWRPHNFPIRMTTGPTNFKLKLYWDVKFWWQEENFDRRWCLRCRRGCYPGNGLMIVWCDQNQRGEQIPNRWSFVRTATTITTSDTNNNDAAYMIQVMDDRSNNNACLSRLNLTPLSEQNLEIQRCDENDSKQHWVASSGNFTRGKAFQISPVDNPAYCITQRHHPRYGETVDIEPCATAKKSHTENWNIY